MVHDSAGDIIHISHGFKGDIPEYQPQGDTKALARYVTQCRLAEGDIMRQEFLVIEFLFLRLVRISIMDRSPASSDDDLQIDFIFPRFTQKR